MGRKVVVDRSEEISSIVCRKRSWSVIGFWLRDVGGVLEALGGLELAFRGDHLRAPLALGLGLARHRALHAARDLDVLDLGRWKP